MTAPVRVYVDAVFAARVAPIHSTLACLLDMGGWHAVEAKDEKDADVVYGPPGTGRRSQAGRVWLESVLPWAWGSLERSVPVTVDGHVLPSRALTERGGRSAPDWVAVAAFFLCGMHENDRSLMESDRPWATPGPRLAEWGLTTVPTVRAAVRDVAERLAVAAPELPPAPRWPMGKRWALTVTHDIDRYRKYRVDEFVRYAGLLWGRGRPAAAVVTLGKALVSVAGALLTDPYVQSFRDWIAFEQAAGIRSSIYVSVVPRVDPQATELDVPYALTDRGLLDWLRCLDGEGWEIGVHSSVRAWTTDDGYARERARLHSTTSILALGVRGHYWSLDPADREESLRRIASAGFRYDSSLGMNTVEGYRRGAGYPYRPFSMRDGEPLGLWEVPPTVMDYALFRAGRTYADRVAALRRRVDEVKWNGGLLVLDWHSDSLAREYMEGTTPAVLDLLRDAAEDSTCWIAPARDIVAWCSEDRWRT